MDIIFAGTPEVALPSLQALLDSQHRVVAVLTRPDAPVGRKRVLTPSPVKVAAQAAGIPVLEAERLRGSIIDELANFHADAVAVVAYGAIAGPRALATVAQGWFNLHFSLLPHWRGAAPVQRALLAGAETSGVSIFKLDTGMDTGDIARQAEYDLTDHPDAGSALTAFAQAGAEELVAAFDDLAAGTAQLRPQPAHGSHAPKITAADAQLDLRQTAAAVLARAKATSPTPGPWVELAGKRTKLAGLRAGTLTLPPGHVTVQDGEVHLGTGSHSLVIDKIQPFGKPMMDAVDFHRGRGDLTFDLKEQA